MKTQCHFEKITQEILHPDGYYKQQQEYVRELAKLDDSRVLPFLLDFSLNRENDWFVREATVECLGDFKCEAVVAAVSKLLEENHDVIRQSAMKAAVKLKETSLVPAICSLLESNSVFLKWNAAKALGELGNPKTVDDLVKMLAAESQPDGLILSHTLDSLEMLLRKCSTVDELRKYENSLSKCFFSLAEKADVHTLAKLKSLETQAREERKKRTKLKDLFSRTHTVFVLTRAYRAARHGLRKARTPQG
jgi:hypothetical protein